jgi:hypothetical protein
MIQGLCKTPVSTQPWLTPVNAPPTPFPVVTGTRCSRPSLATSEGGVIAAVTAKPSPKSRQSRCLRPLQGFAYLHLTRSAPSRPGKETWDGASSAGASSVRKARVVIRDRSSCVLNPSVNTRELVEAAALPFCASPLVV